MKKGVLEMRNMIRNIAGWINEEAESIITICLGIGFCFVMWVLVCFIVAVLG